MQMLNAASKNPLIPEGIKGFFFIIKNKTRIELLFQLAINRD